MNAVANSGMCSKHKTRTKQDLTRRLKKETADEFEGGRRNVAEARRAKWTTHQNLKIWFDTWKNTCIELGFARARNDNDGDDIVGDLHNKKNSSLILVKPLFKNTPSM